MIHKHGWSDPSLARAASGSPVTVLAQLALEHLLADGPLDALFEQARDGQYTRTLTFGAVVDLMAGVVLCCHASVRKAWQARRDALGVTLQAVYDKLRHVSPGLCAALVTHMAARATALITRGGGARPAPLPGWTVRMLDGNHLAATERRPAPLRGSHAGPLPGLGLVVDDPQLVLPVALFASEDAYTQERALLAAVLDGVAGGECSIADRNFCVTSFLRGVVARRIVHHPTACQPHAHHARSASTRRPRRRRDGLRRTGRARRRRRHDARVAPDRRRARHAGPARQPGDRGADGPAGDDRCPDGRCPVSDRWQIETAFLRLATLRRSEIAPLAYPRAALFGFTVARVAYMVLAVVQAALRAEHGPDLDARLSVHAIVEEVSKTHRGMMRLVPSAAWAPYRRLAVAPLARLLVTLAADVDLAPLQKARRGPKKPPTPWSRFTNRPHVSTRRVLDGTQQDDS